MWIWNQSRTHNSVDTWIDYLFAFLYRGFNVLVLKSEGASNGTASLADSLYFSTMVFTAQIPANMQAKGSWMYLVTIERLLGYLFLALFVVVLAKKLIR
jgi:hypothetical protein